MGDIMQRHLPDVLCHSIDQNHPVLICLNDPHVTTGKIGQQHPECNRNQQQWLILLLDTQIEQDERDGIHYQKLRFSHYIAESSHIIQILKYLVHYPILINTSSSETASPALAQIAVTFPSNSAQMAL